MAIKLKPNKKGKGARARATITKHTDDESVEEELATGEFPHPTDGSPHSEVRAGYGIRASKPGTYSSAAFEIEVMIPCKPGEELEAGDAAVAKVKAIYGKYQDDFDAAVESL